MRVLSSLLDTLIPSRQRALLLALELNATRDALRQMYEVVLAGDPNAGKLEAYIDRGPAWHAAKRAADPSTCPLLGRPVAVCPRCSA